jgi:Replication-relaxation
MTLSTITNKQQIIIRLLYRYRFLDRKQIQSLLQHKDKRRIITWLKDLREKQYAQWIYDGSDFAAKTKPAIYYIGLAGIRYLKKTSDYQTLELRKRYKESGRTQSYISRCLLLADCCISLDEKTKTSANLRYSYLTEADYSNSDSPYNSLLGELKPHLYFAKDDSKTNTTYVMELFDALLPRHQVRKRLGEYLEYLRDREADASNSIALFAFSSTADLLYAKRRLRLLLEDDEGNELIIRLTIMDKIRKESVVGKIWEEV